MTVLPTSLRDAPSDVVLALALSVASPDDHVLPWSKHEQLARLLANDCGPVLDEVRARLAAASAGQPSLTAQVPFCMAGYVVDQAIASRDARRN